MGGGLPKSSMFLSVLKMGTALFPVKFHIHVLIYVHMYHRALVRKLYPRFLMFRPHLPRRVGKVEKDPTSRSIVSREMLSPRLEDWAIHLIPRSP
ncbi:hypothetical protein ACOSQ4_014080 [Xanthoceras sorbifolium]